MSDPAILPNPSSPNVYGPITAGQMFERAFTLLRENFKLFFGIVLILIGVEIVVGGILIAFSGGTVLGMGRSAADGVPMARLLFLAPVFAVGAVLFFILVQIIQGALFIATQAKLVQAPMTVGEACKFAADKAGRLIGISLLILVRVIGYVLLFLAAAAIIGGALALLIGVAHVFGASPFRFGHRSLLGLGIFILVSICLLVLYLFFWLWLVARYSLSIPAALAENLHVTDAIRRSIHLSHGSRGRLYALLVAMVGVDLAIAVVTVPLQLLLNHGGNMHGGAALGAGGILLAVVRLLISAFVMAFIGIATALCYYDLRVRKEGFGRRHGDVVSSHPAGNWPVSPDVTPGDLPIT
ncbi:MAG: glycerophosphoryl diester phosphodiesterase membrane domain-containing protein [Acidobacteriaceae bacterium]